MNIHVDFVNDIEPSSYSIHSKNNLFKIIVNNHQIYMQGKL